MLIIIKLQVQNYIRMMKKIYTLLFCITVSALVKINAQALYLNTTQTSSRFNPGLGQSGTPKVVFDDIQIDNATVADADSIGFTKIKVGIRRIASAPAVTVNVYLTGLDPASFTLDSLPAIPATLIGTFNLPANGATSQTQILSIGDSINVFQAIKRDTSNFIGGFQAAFIGVSFSTDNSSNGWRFTSDGGNYDAAWLYNADSVQPRNAIAFATLTSTFYIEAYGRTLYAPLAFDMKTLSITPPQNISCLSGPQTVTVEIQNLGQSTVPAGQAGVNLKVGGANTYDRIIANTTNIPANGTEIITFNDVDLSNPGTNFDTATVFYEADLRNTNDQITSGSITAGTISTFPALEDVEGSLPVISFVSTIAGDQLWTIHSADTAYTNGDMVDSLHPNGGTNFFYFDSYRSPNSTGFESRLFSNCVRLGNGACTSSLSFFMSHDTTFLSNGWDDSLYVSISTDKGQTWNRIGAGFGRLDPSFGVPGWRQEIVDLTPYQGQTFQLAFEGVSAWGSIIGLDDISIESNCVTPVNLVNFSVQKQNRANRLSWKTSQEVNSLKYVVEQSKDGSRFTTIGEVEAAGNSSTERTYSFTHNLPSKGYNYYRIKMVDRDNKAKYTPVRSVLNLGLNEINVTPNPVTNTMKLNINADKADVAAVVVTDVSGKTVYSQTYTVAAGDNSIPVSTAGLNAGNYIIKVQLNGDVQVTKFIKL